MQPSRRPTIRDVAAQAGVSVATVSKVINQRYGVAAGTISKVNRVIEETGYSASLVAQSLRNHRTNVLGILVADLEPFSAELLKGAADAVRGSGFELVVYSAGGRAEDHQGWERRYLSRLSGTLVDGAVVVTPTIVDVNYGAPVVAVDPHTGPTTVPTVDADNLRGAESAVRHLVSLGHRRIGMVTGRADLQSARLREAGFRDAMAGAGLKVAERLVRPGDYVDDRSAEAARELLQSKNRPTAIFGANDVSALAVARVAAELGIDVPGELSVVGFDNIPESALGPLRLTTVAQPIREMGRQAVAMLLELVRQKPLATTHLTLPTELVVRDSTGRASK